MSFGKWFNDSVDAFKAAFAANPALYEWGQHYMFPRTFDAVCRIVKGEISAADDIPYGLEVAFDKYKEDGYKVRDRISAVLKSITEYSKDPELNKKTVAKFPQTVKAFSADPGAKAEADRQFNALWDNTDIPAPPALTNPTAEKAFAMFEKEKGACGKVAASMIRKYLKARKKSPTYAGPPFAGTIANAKLKTKSAVEKNNPDTVVYSPTAALKTPADALEDAVGKIGAAVSRGYVYQCGVSSGYIHDKATFPTPEHYVVLLAYDGTDSFMIWDPDSTSTDIKSQSKGPGFGLITLAGTHFSTAYDDDDFVRINGNYHSSDPIRHRYQLYSAQPFPAPSS
jgi:hypothetical protein